MELRPHGPSAAGESRAEFGLLGPLTTRVNGRPVRFPSPKHRIVLAALLLNAGRAVPVEDLVNAVWGDTPPRNPRRAVQLYVTRIRASLAEEKPGQVIVTHANGYAVEAEPDRVDLGRFEFWRDRARQAAVKGDLDAEADLLGLALTQWRGEPLADVPSNLLHQEDVPRLREQRLSVLDRRIQVDLRRRRHAELIGELRALTARHPFHERFWGYLMTALHGIGRRADALETYRAARRQLAEELGIAPGAELQALHARILAEDGGGVMCHRRPRAESGSPGARGAGTGTWHR
ncbi:AfsR/SARP family transcriptional regulator [Nonomuraea jiangxiensis]|uniref:DNA-binding transcriptional activator of the SARP family n=1 Tax=Nonomuraea jiangxiensis TaxID=633440 RepID=A0A1G8I7M8_9ACTN|nr:AfsR/SARP family transcriptional regulator [Nonomuraea jiangxiensis]SDI14923.1 DNA-binding transcriptional activator of the SARP family [Nonomuraea jiangxiensis]